VSLSNLRRVLIHDQADRDASASQLMRYRDDRGNDWATSSTAGNFYAGFFEEISPEDFRKQVEVTLFGPMNVTRAVLPVMRAQRSGLVVAISSTAGVVGQDDQCLPMKEVACHVAPDTIRLLPGSAA
jgi:NAD(P)-dependent dehydrogenase (short-subunit alcohol dehydrogenase family)